MIDIDALRSELADIDHEIERAKTTIQNNNKQILLKFTENPGGVIGALLDNTPHFARYAELRDLRERLLVSIATIESRAS